MTANFPADWFWVVAGDESHMWSSAAGGYVAPDDPAFAAWTDQGGMHPSRISSEAELGDVLAGYGLPTGVLPAPRREIPKHVVQDRLHALGKLDACFAVILSNAALFGEWFAHGPNVYADDAGFIQILQAIGCTTAEIAQVTA